MSFAVLRLRGKSDLRRDVKDTLRMLHLTRQNHCSIVPEDPTYRGKLLLKRGRQIGDKPIDDSFVKGHSKFKSIWDLSQAITKGEATLADVRELRPVLRLPPPRKGYRGIKRGFHDGGDLGYRGGAINSLLVRMLLEEGKDGL